MSGCASSATFQKNFGRPLRTPEQRYQRIDEMNAEHPVDEICRAFDVSRSGYYDWSQGRERPGPRALEDAALRPQIAAICQERDGTWPCLLGGKTISRNRSPPLPVFNSDCFHPKLQKAASAKILVAERNGGTLSAQARCRSVFV